MKLVLKKAALGAAANVLQKVINPKNALPILGDVLFDVKDGQATLTASDSEVTMQTTVTLDTMEGDGRFCTSASQLCQALAQIGPANPVTIIADTENGDTAQFRLSHESGEAHFPIDNADEYPLPQADKFTETLTISGDRLRDGIRRAVWATANDDLRPVMCGVEFALVEGSLDIVASDGHVLVKTSYDVDGLDTKRCGSFIMPKKVAAILASTLQATDEVQMEWNDRECRLQFDPYVLTFRLIEGRYPKYNTIIPQDQPLEATLPRVLALSKVKAVQPFASDSSQLVRLSFEADRLTVTGEDYDFSRGATDTLYCDYSGKPITLGLKGTTLATVLSKMEGQELCLSMTDPSRAIVFRPNGDNEGQHVLMLMMPMLINED